VSHFLRPTLAGMLAALALAPAALAADLNPPPPDFYTCGPSGQQTICHAHRTFHEDPVVTDVSCPGFPIVDQGDVAQRAIRYYNADGNLTRRVIHETWTNSFWSNPLNGNTIPYTQRDTTTDNLSVPGDLASATETQTGENVYTDPVTHQKVLRSTGRTVFGSDGTLEFSAGQQPFIDLFVYGDPSGFTKLCAALAR
jgi:hypothetical protein